MNVFGRYGTEGPRFTQYHADYKKLYVDTVRAAVKAEGSATPFAVSSPSNGKASEDEDFLATNPYSALYGDGKGGGRGAGPTVG